MICPTCTAAADQRLTRDYHCTDAGCTCGHRTERYGTTTALGAANERPPDATR